MTFWDLWRHKDRGEALPTFSSLTVTTSQQNSSPISSRTTITSQLSLHAQTGLQSSFGREWVLRIYIYVYGLTSCLYVGSLDLPFLYSYSYFLYFSCLWQWLLDINKNCYVEAEVGMILQKWDTWCLHYTPHAQGIALARESATATIRMGNEQPPKCVPLEDTMR